MLLAPINLLTLYWCPRRNQESDRARLCNGLWIRSNESLTGRCLCWNRNQYLVLKASLKVLWKKIHLPLLCTLRLSFSSPLMPARAAWNNFINFLSVIKSEPFLPAYNQCNPSALPLILVVLLFTLCLVPSTRGAWAQCKALSICASTWTVCWARVSTGGNEALRNCSPMAFSLEQNFVSVSMNQRMNMKLHFPPSLTFASELWFILFFFFLLFHFQGDNKMWKASKIDLQL